MRHDTEHYRLIAGALVGQTELPREPWDWDATIRIAAREEILPALHGRLNCPTEIANFFSGIHELNSERNRALLAQTEAVAALLNRVGIEPVLLKGAAYLLSGVYADQGDRLLHDIDLLVPPDQSRQAYELVHQAGYQPYIPNPTALVLHHHPALTQVNKIPVEIHRTIGTGSCQKILPSEDIIARSRPIRLGSAVVRIPSPEHLMTHLIVHSQMQHGPYERIWPSLRMMLDLVTLNRTLKIDWEQVASRFRSRNKAALLNLHLVQVESALKIELPLRPTAGGIRWLYRRALWREPRLRHIDPFYTCSRIIGPKLRLGWRLLREPAGRRYIIKTPLRSAFYKRLLDDILQG